MKCRARSGNGIMSGIGIENGVKSRIKNGIRIRIENETGTKIENVTSVWDPKVRLGSESKMISIKKKENSTYRLMQLRPLTIRASHLQETAEQGLPDQLVYY
ncbi:hypothetical protein EVAR_86219_1 [Eumeta japonica]|uniref:Uncharacterized protein n=1 Tax=Eumeta variegata TaxID=151549 RepID=A0A4C1UD03_EUMVA|nr:hypothetical protein EVAR_86219_1 [Eumeta japonica]